MAVGIKGLLAVLFGVVVFVAACAPGSNPGDQGDNGGGGGGEQSSSSEVSGSTTGSSGGGGGSSEQEFLKFTGPYCPGAEDQKELDGMSIGFSQSEKETNPFRSTETESIKQAAQDNGVDLSAANGQTQQAKQISDIRDLLSRDPDALIIAPLLSSGLGSSFSAAKDQDVPVVLIDRETKGEPCEDYITQIQSNFVRQGTLAAEFISDNTDGDAKVAVLEGTPGASVVNERTEGFQKGVKAASNMEVVASQTANFVRTDGQQVMEQLLQANPDINAVYAENDEMAIGAITAIRAAGKTPGEDVLVVGTDGSRDAAQAVSDGDMSATVTTNPRFGPISMRVLKMYFSGEKVPQQILVKDEVVSQDNAQAYLDGGAY